ncbi:hypothetical protein [Actinoplanes siamensis]|uniref:Uncharacterized protein n=1 Tax=Actinoplanes siamensis TaxID=1223317 RepID=A0A919NF84_9ACTN|nr:hypothetical protein [Actinoplanes siamensis]GIF09599.1 hypothetical protein Asi03nite_71370 [Actinoplanes siamensis]
MWPLRRGPSIDPAQGDPRARAPIDALSTRDRVTVHDIFAAATDPDDRASAMNAAQQAPGVGGHRRHVHHGVPEQPAVSVRRTGF